MSALHAVTEADVIVSKPYSKAGGQGACSGRSHLGVQQVAVDVRQLRGHVLDKPGVPHDVLNGAALLRVRPEHVVDEVLALRRQLWVGITRQSQPRGTRQIACTTVIESKHGTAAMPMAQAMGSTPPRCRSTCTQGRALLSLVSASAGECRLIRQPGLIGQRNARLGWGSSRPR